MASSFRTPDGSRLMDTFRGSFIDHLRSWHVLCQHRRAPRLLREWTHQVLPDERTEESDVMGQYGGEPLFQAVHRYLSNGRNDVHRASILSDALPQPGKLHRRHLQRAREERIYRGGTE